MLIQLVTVCPIHVDQWFSTFFELGPTLILKKMSGPTKTTICEKHLFLLRYYIAYHVI